jgi:preprotein translocase subunit YajC
MNAAIEMMILLMVITVVGFIYFTIQDRKEAKQINKVEKI